MATYNSNDLTPEERRFYAGQWCCPYCGKVSRSLGEAAPLCCGELHSYIVTAPEPKDKGGESK